MGGTHDHPGRHGGIGEPGHAIFWAKNTPVERDRKWLEPRYKYADWPKYPPPGSW